MNLIQALQTTTQTFTEAGIPMAEKDALALIEHTTGRTKLEVMLDGEQEISEQEEAALQACIAKRLQRVPLAYITGQAYFWGHTFAVTEGVLVPRPDSETILATLETLIEDKAQPFTVADIGVGSGCLLLSILKEYSNATGFGIDCESTPLEITAQNAQTLGVSARTTLINGKGASPLPHTVDVLISNPPYIGLREWDALQPEVQKHEPKAALFAGEDGLDMYQTLIPEAAEKLKSGGILLLEIGHEQQKDVTDLLKDDQWQAINCIKDLSGNNRVLLALKR